MSVCVRVCVCVCLCVRVCVARARCVRLLVHALERDVVVRCKAELHEAHTAAHACARASVSHRAPAARGGTERGRAHKKWCRMSGSLPSSAGSWIMRCHALRMDTRQRGPHARSQCTLSTSLAHTHTNTSTTTTTPAITAATRSNNAHELTLYLAHTHVHTRTHTRTHRHTHNNTITSHHGSKHSRHNREHPGAHVNPKAARERAGARVRRRPSKGAVIHVTRVRPVAAAARRDRCCVVARRHHVTTTTSAASGCSSSGRFASRFSSAPLLHVHNAVLWRTHARVQFRGETGVRARSPPHGPPQRRSPTRARNGGTARTETGHHTCASAHGTRCTPAPPRRCPAGHGVS